MFTIDMTTIHPLGEFGSEAWCQACADSGKNILEQSVFIDLCGLKTSATP